jgi:hypothetical protein
VISRKSREIDCIRVFSRGKNMISKIRVLFRSDIFEGTRENTALILTWWILNHGNPILFYLENLTFVLRASFCIECRGEDPSRAR